MVWDTYPSSSLLIWSQNPMMYSQSSCLLDGLVALSSARERKYVTKQAKRNSIKSHAFPRERRLTSIANYKKEEKLTHAVSGQGKGCFQVDASKYPARITAFQKADAKCQVLRNMLFQHCKWKYKRKYLNLFCFPLPEMLFLSYNNKLLKG